VGLPLDTPDREVWRFAQTHQMLLLTDNRNMAGDESLEQTIREESTATPLPVITIGRADRIANRSYRERSAAWLLEIVLSLDSYLGAGRLYVP
jgi:hypothetical protein